MSFGDFSARFKQAKGDDKASDKPYDHAESYRIRAKILGVLICDARNSAARTLEDCARLLNVAPETVESWEHGEQVPDLAQLELLAYYLDVPISHFWGSDLMDADRTQKLHTQGEYMALRHRMIGALLRQAREEAQLSVEDVSQQSGIPAEQLAAYEVGDAPVPMNEMYVLSNVVRKNMDYFMETTGYVGELLQIREEWKKFMSLDEDVRRFAANPQNYGFIKIAMMFSQMPVEQLRKVAEGMLDITM
jgi:transcriptional regulator with XRE-family HTH domain